MATILTIKGTDDRILCECVVDGSDILGEVMGNWGVPRDGDGYVLPSCEDADWWVSWAEREGRICLAYAEADDAAREACDRAALDYGDDLGRLQDERERILGIGDADGEEYGTNYAVGAYEMEALYHGRDLEDSWQGWVSEYFGAERGWVEPVWCDEFGGDFEAAREKCREIIDSWHGGSYEFHPRPTGRDGVTFRRVELVHEVVDVNGDILRGYTLVKRDSLPKDMLEAMGKGLPLEDLPTAI